MCYKDHIIDAKKISDTYSHCHVRLYLHSVRILYALYAPCLHSVRILYALYALCTHSVRTLYAFCMHCMHTVSILYAFCMHCMHPVCTLYAFCMHCLQIFFPAPLQQNTHVPVTRFKGTIPTSISFLSVISLKLSHSNPATPHLSFCIIIILSSSLVT